MIGGEIVGCSTVTMQWAPARIADLRPGELVGTRIKLWRNAKDSWDGPPTSKPYSLVL